MGQCCSVIEPDLNDEKFRRVLWFALLSNAAMFFVELAAGVLSGSVSLQADALDFFGDSANYAISLFVLGLSLRARSGAALIKGGSMALFGLWVIGSAIYRAFEQSIPEATIMGATSVLALIVNISVAAMLFQHRGGDSNRLSVWLCSRNDAIVNIVVLLAAGGVAVTSTGWPDIAVALVIATLSLTSAYQVFRQAAGELRQMSMAPLDKSRPTQTDGNR